MGIHGQHLMSTPGRNNILHAARMKMSRLNSSLDHIDIDGKPNEISRSRNAWRYWLSA